MIIQSIHIKNFGLYKGENTLVLNTTPTEQKNITVITGKNGVGKSTLQEAIHLCLLGSLAIDIRLSEADYDRYLQKRIHNGANSNEETAIELNFEFIKSGKAVKYSVTRSWYNNDKNCNEKISITEDDKELTELSKKEKNFFLRELIQPGLSKVIFFDGEKLASLYDSDDNLTRFVSDGCKYIFGLNFAHLLEKDLSVYINKLLTEKKATQKVNELKQVKETLHDISEKLSALAKERKESLKELKQIKLNVEEKEAEIAEQGRWVTKELDALKAQKQQLENEIKSLKKELSEYYTHLGPFAFCQHLCVSLKNRLSNEREIEKWQHAREMLKKKAKEIDDFLKEKKQDRLTKQIKQILLAKPGVSDNSDKIHHKISDTERTRLINWIDEVVNVLAKKLRDKTNQLIETEEQLKKLNQKQKTFSKEEHIQPLMADLQGLNQKYGALEQRLDSLMKKEKEEKSRQQFYQQREKALQRKITEQRSVGDQFKLSQKTQLVIKEYARKLLTKKLALLEDKVLQKFNTLCRKSNYFDAIKIHPETFDIVLNKKGVTTNHKQLSAGEKQLLVLSILWGLRELTNISIPLIMDTPLARLDKEHRTSFLKNFLPAIHPQVILIGTEMELDIQAKEMLKPYTANAYHLTYNPTIHAAEIHEDAMEEKLEKEAV